MALINADIRQSNEALVKCLTSQDGAVKKEAAVSAPDSADNASPFPPVSFIL